MNNYLLDETYVYHLLTNSANAFSNSELYEILDTIVIDIIVKDSMTDLFNVMMNTHRRLMYIQINRDINNNRIDRIRFYIRHGINNGPKLLECTARNNMHIETEYLLDRRTMPTRDAIKHIIESDSLCIITKMVNVSRMYNKLSDIKYVIDKDNSLRDKLSDIGLI